MDAITQGALIGIGGAVAGALIGQVGQVWTSRQQRKKEHLQLVLEAAKHQSEAVAELATHMAKALERPVAVLPFAAELYYSKKAIDLMEQGKLTEEVIKTIGEERRRLSAILTPGAPLAGY